MKLYIKFSIFDSSYVKLPEDLMKNLSLLTLSDLIDHFAK